MRSSKILLFNFILGIFSLTSFSFVGTEIAIGWNTLSSSNLSNNELNISLDRSNGYIDILLGGLTARIGGSLSFPYGIGLSLDVGYYANASVGNVEDSNLSFRYMSVPFLIGMSYRIIGVSRFSLSTFFRTGLAFTILPVGTLTLKSFSELPVGTLTLKSFSDPSLYTTGAKDSNKSLLSPYFINGSRTSYMLETGLRINIISSLFVEASYAFHLLNIGQLREDSDFISYTLHTFIISIGSYHKWI